MVHGENTATIQFGSRKLVLDFNYGERTER